MLAPSPEEESSAEKAPPKAELKLDDKVIETAVVVGTEDEHGLDIGKLRGADRLRDAGPGVHEHGVHQERDHVPGRRARHLRYRGIPDRRAGREVDVRRGRYLLIYGQLPNKTSWRRSRAPLTRTR
jgi:citrate synthase